MRPKNLNTSLQFMMQMGQPVLLKGAPGTAKTSIVKQVADELGWDCLIQHPITWDPTDVRGIPYVDKTGAKFQPTSELQKMIYADKPTIVFFDDVGQAAGAVQAAIMQIILERRINGYHVSDNTVFVAATNRREDKAGVSSIITPLVNRFVVLDAEVHVDDWTVWATNNNMPSMLIAFLNFRPDVLYDMDPNETAQMNNAPTPRSWHFVGNMINQGMSSETRLDLMAGAVGAKAATDFESFLRIYEKLPDVKKVLEKCQIDKIPNASEDPSVMYSFVVALGNHVNEDTMDSFWKIINTVSAEYAVLGVRVAKAKHSWISHSNKMVEFMTNHGVELGLSD